MKYTMKDMENAYTLKQMDKKKNTLIESAKLQGYLDAINRRSEEFDEILDMMEFAEANTDFIDKYPYRIDSHRRSAIWADAIKHALGLTKDFYDEVFELAVIGGGANGDVSVRYRKGYGAYYSNVQGVGSRSPSHIATATPYGGDTLFHADRFVASIDDFIELFEYTIGEYIEEARG